MSNIGGDTASFVLNATATGALGLVSTMRPSCQLQDSYYHASFYYRYFALHWQGHSVSTQPTDLWNLSAAIGLSFTGSKVAENSTFITGVAANGLVVFNDTFERRYPPPASGNKSGAGTQVGSLWAQGGMGAALGLLLLSFAL